MREEGEIQKNAGLLQQGKQLKFRLIPCDAEQFRIILMCSVLGVIPDVFHMVARNEVKHAASSHETVRYVFGEPKHSELDDGLNRMAEWVKQRGSHQSVKFEGIEI